MTHEIDKADIPATDLHPNIPTSLYLQVCNEDSADPEEVLETGEMSWCATRIYDSDVRYVREDFVLKLAKVRAEIARIAKETGELEELRASAEITRKLLEKARTELAEAKTRKEVAAAALRVERVKVDDLLSQVFDVAVVKSAVATMARNMVPADRGKKAKFEEARTIVKAARDKLREAGFVCRALSVAASANVNRPDRDNPANISAAEWYVLSKYESVD